MEKLDPVGRHIPVFLTLVFAPWSLHQIFKLYPLKNKKVGQKLDFDPENRFTNYITVLGTLQNIDVFYQMLLYN